MAEDQGKRPLAAPGSKRGWRPPAFVDEGAMEDAPITADGEQPQKRFYRYTQSPSGAFTCIPDRRRGSLQG
jgi:hypothetical protein